jgi:SAM-dependent methyltransferase
MHDEPKKTIVDHYDSTYGHFTEDVLDAVRKEAYGTDIGQNSWLTVDEYERLIPSLVLTAADHVLEVACGSGGPARWVAHATGCTIVGIDVNAHAIATAQKLIAGTPEAPRVSFRLADANAPLPFEDDSFDGLICIDSMNHFPDRLAVLKEWRRVLRPGRRALFTDPVVITGPITSDEIAERASIGVFVFVPGGHNRRLIAEAGLHFVQEENVSDNAAAVAARRRDARRNHRDALVGIEGEGRFEERQRFFDAVHTLTRDRKLSRIAYVAEKPGR